MGKKGGKKRGSGPSGGKPPPGGSGSAGLPVAALVAGAAVVAAAVAWLLLAPPATDETPPSGSDGGWGAALRQLQARERRLASGAHLIRRDEAAQLASDLAAACAEHQQPALDGLHGGFLVRWRHALEEPNKQARRGGELLASSMPVAPTLDGLTALGSVQVMLNDFAGAVASFSVACGVSRGGAPAPPVPPDGPERSAAVFACLQLAYVLQQYTPPSGSADPEAAIARGVQIARSGETCEFDTLRATLGVMTPRTSPPDKNAVAAIARDDPDCVPAQLYQRLGYGRRRMELESTRRMALVDPSSWELHFTLFQELLAAELQTAADAALRTALRVHPALAQKLEMEYLQAPPEQTLLPHLRRAVLVLRELDKQHQEQVAAAVDAVAAAGHRTAAPGAGSSFCPADAAAATRSDQPQLELSPPNPDAKLGAKCKRITQAEAAEHFRVHGWDEPVVVAADGSGDPPAWATPSELVRLAGNESFRISWVFESGDLNAVHTVSGLRKEPVVANAATSHSGNRALVRPPMAAVSMATLVDLMQQRPEPAHGAAAASSLPSLDGTRRVYLNQKAVPNFVAPLEEQVGPPPSWVGSDRRALSHLWMGNAPVITGLHTDQFDNIIRVHRGRKSVLLFRPDQRKLLYYEPVLDVYTEYNVSTASARVVSATVSSNHALVGLRDGDGGSAGFPLFEQAAGLGCELGPGDTIMIPKLWHHAVASTPDDGWSAPLALPSFVVASPHRGGVVGRSVHVATNWWFAKS